MATRIIPEDVRSYAIRFVLLTLATFLGATIGLILLPEGSSAALVWPPAAIGIAALFLFGYDLWPALLLSICAIFFLRSGNLPIAIGISVADTLEALMGAFILKRYIRLNPLINTLRDAYGLMAASIIPTLVSSNLIALTFYYLRPDLGSGTQALWTTIWVGHAVTSLSLTPFLIRWLHRPVFIKTKAEIAEGIVLFGTIATISYFNSWTTHTSVASISLIYILIFPLFWAALRAGPRGTTLALFIFSSVAITGIFYGHGPLAISHDSQQVFVAQILIGVLDIIFILFAAIVEERKDITNSLAHNVERLERAIEKIRLEDQAKTNFLAILAHELRNPLAPIVSSVELLKSGETTPDQPALIDTIESHAQDISLLLDDLLDITRITQNKFELKREPITIQHVLKRSLETVRAFLLARGHQFTMEIPQSEVWLNADPLRLEQVFVNLLNNAIKYTDKRGVITLTCRVEGREVVVSIQDNGIGIAPDKIGGVFEPFGQIGAVLRLPGGLGVGLSLTKRLLEQHQGSIEAKSLGLGHGSEFIMRLPISGVSTSIPKRRGFIAALQRTKAAGRENKNRGRVLIVDDNEPAAQGLAKLLEHSGYRVALAYDGTGALMMAKDFKPTAIILDIGLPDMSGYEVSKRIREKEPSNGQPVRIIGVSGYGQDGDKLKAREAGFDVHLVKPVSIVDVERALQ